jgi:hypothetical protein
MSKETISSDSGWQDDDEVTTTYGSLQLGLGQAHEAGILTERKRISKSLRVTFALYAGFHPEIGQAILGIIKDVDPALHEEISQTLIERTTNE